MNQNYENLINSLVRDGYLKTPLLIEAFKKIDRKDFVLDEYENSAYENIPLPIGFEQTISQPLTVAFMFELLDPKPGEKILDVGVGSGWTTALLAQIAGDAVGVERIQELKDFAEKNLVKYGFIDPIRNEPSQASCDAPSARRISNGVRNGLVKLFVGDGAKGCKKEAPFDKIIAGAATEGEVPMEWKKQLKIGGRIVAPVGNSVVVIDKIGKAKYSQKTHFGFNFVPLISDK